MSSEVTGAGPLAGEAAQGLPAFAPQARAYAGFVLAGWAVAAAAWMLLESTQQYLDVLTNPARAEFWLLVLPGPAAALGAAAVHRPFMRALRAGRAAHAHGWAAGAALAAHVAYAALVFAAVLVWGTTARHAPPAIALNPLAEAEDYAMIAGVVSLTLGFLPNVLVAEAFAGFMVARQAARRRAGLNAASLMKGARHAPSVPAE